MSVLSVPARIQANLATKLPAMLLLGGALNGFVVRIAEQWHLNAGQAALFGISPFELIAIAVAAYLYFECPNPARIGFGLAEILFLTALMIPSSTFSWAATAVYAFYHAGRSGSGERTASLLFLGLALCSIWSSVIMKWISVPVTAFEANIIWYMLSFFRDDIQLDGNVMGIPGGHQIILMIACSTIYGLPKALLGLIAIALFLGPVKTRPLGQSAVLVVIAYALANFIRLFVMTWSDPAFQIAHGPIGANIFDAAVTIIVFATAFTIAQRPEDA